MGENRNGRMGRYTAQQFIDAIPGTGGVISAIAEKVECAWNTAKKYIDEHPTVKQAWENERRRVTDRAQHNVIRAIEAGDLAMSKWWLVVMDDEFQETKNVRVSGDAVKAYIGVSPDDWPGDDG